MNTRLPRLLTLPSVLAAIALALPSLHATTTVIDFSGADFAANNLTAGVNPTNLSFSSGTLRMNHTASLASAVTYNNVFPSSVNTDSFTIKVDGKFSVTTGGGDSIGIVTQNTGGATALSGYAGLFRVISPTQADFRLYEGFNTTTGTLGTNLTPTALTVNSTFLANTFYTFSLDVNVTSSTSATFTASVLTTSGSIIGTFTQVIDTTASLGGTTNQIGLRLGTNGNGSNFTTVDNLTLVTTAVPEPSTYALFGGVSALGLALFSRRKRG